MDIESIFVKEEAEAAKKRRYASLGIQPPRSRLNYGPVFLSVQLQPALCSSAVNRRIFQLLANLGLDQVKWHLFLQQSFFLQSVLTLVMQTLSF